MNNVELLRSINFGGRTAEEEAGNLRRIFVETDQWQSVNRGDVDIVYGSKGSGKSAIYSLLQEHRTVSLKRSRIVIPAENPRGATAFKDLETDPPVTEKEFVELWKIYLLCIIADVYPQYSIRNEHSNRVAQTLKDASLFNPKSNLSEKLKVAAQYVKDFFRSVDLGVEIDPTSGAPRLSVKQGSVAQEAPKRLSRTPEALFETADKAFQNSTFELWICIDRLDVAFEDNMTLETNALRALFRVYLDLLSLDHIRLKIFLRSDIWHRITQEGFREASHITRHITLSWSSAQLLNLLMKRLLQSNELLLAYGVERPTILADIDLQRSLFYRIFPRQVDVGRKRPNTWDWILTRITDGTRNSAPRELIHLLTVSRAVQMQHLDIGANMPQGENLFCGAALKEALKEVLKEVSRVRLEQTIYAEHPRLKEFISRLENRKATQTLVTLGRLWETTPSETARKTEELVQVGVLEVSTSQETEYRVPFLYRDALHLIQGKAEESYFFRAVAPDKDESQFRQLEGRC
jgi:hypothetical protein